MNCKNACKPIKDNPTYSAQLIHFNGQSKASRQSRAGSVINCALSLSTGMRKAVLAPQNHQAGATCVQTAGLSEDRQRTGARAATAEGCNQAGAELLQGQPAA